MPFVGIIPTVRMGTFFEDYPLWAEFCCLLLKDIHEKFGKNILVPLTLLRESSYGIIERLRCDKIRTELVILQADRATIHDRILARGEEEGCWCMENIELAMAGSRALPGMHIDAADTTPEKLAHEVLTRLGIS